VDGIAVILPVAHGLGEKDVEEHVVRVKGKLEARPDRVCVTLSDFVCVTLTVLVIVTLPDQVAYLVVGKADVDLVPHGLLVNDEEEHVVRVKGKLEARPDGVPVIVSDFVWLILTVEHPVTLPERVVRPVVGIGDPEVVPQELTVSDVLPVKEEDPHALRVKGKLVAAPVAVTGDALGETVRDQ